MNFSSTRTFASIFFLSIFLAACSSLSNGTQDTPTPVLTELPTETLTPTELPAPTATNQPSLVLLIASPEGDQTHPAELEATLSELADAQGFRFQVRPTLAAEVLTAEVKIVVVVPPFSGLTDLAAGAPQTQFVGIGIPGLEPIGNLSVIGPDGAAPDQSGFLAGFIAGVVTTDWRVGTISTNDSPAGIGSRNGFLNGAVFFCGFCNPTYPPFYEYPLFVGLHSGATLAEWLVLADTIKDNYVETVYVAPYADGNELLAYLAGAGVNIIGGVTPPDDIRPNWVATVHADSTDAIQQIWPELVNGNGGFKLPLTLKISNVNEDLFSPGRQRLVEQIRLDLQNGFIDTGVDPLTGENK
jgi:hypothetical protein